ncbi:MAG: hypothetical protein AW10_04061 [Candidatus Accumulibacter appositus]|mgnify:CR=1 FL=1|uniref:Uncharacterized protein n=1 Tax=Candidatus Accumulibacter appositus TaxID=1454003 RepID=A0A011N3F7_9PROT|nr:MAG: hypothetical protein AW10_04061 [Candidatus Accumulibacter appositus]MCB1968081.1 hypothetical protein [Accumulibacter sp.]
MKKAIERPGCGAAKQILATLSQTVSRSHFVELLAIKGPAARDSQGSRHARR